MSHQLSQRDILSNQERMDQDLMAYESYVMALHNKIYNRMVPVTEKPATVSVFNTVPICGSSPMKQVTQALWIIPNQAYLTKEKNYLKELILKKSYTNPWDRVNKTPKPLPSKLSFQILCNHYNQALLNIKVISDFVAFDFVVMSEDLAKRVINKCRNYHAKAKRAQSKMDRLKNMDVNACSIPWIVPPAPLPLEQILNPIKII